MMTFLGKLDLYFRQHRKTVLENLGLIVAVLAAAFAGWSGYEARKARFDAADNNRRTIELQQKSVAAQLEATQLDERPFISVQSSHLDGGQLGRGLRLTFTYKIIAHGKTPAFNLKLWDTCLLNVPDATPLLKGSLTREGYPYSPLLLNEAAERACHVNLTGTAKGFVLAGNVTYRDYFKTNHKTPFCIIVFPEGALHVGRLTYSEYACSELAYESD